MMKKLIITIIFILYMSIFSNVVSGEENVVLPEQNVSVITIKVLREATKENNLQKINTYRAVIKDQAGNLVSGAQISFEAYGDANKYSMVKAKEVAPGDYIAEISLAKNTNWSVTVLGVWDSYPFRVNFNEVFIKPSESIAENQKKPNLEKENKTQDIYKPKNKEKKISPIRKKIVSTFNIVTAAIVILLIIVGIVSRRIKK